MRGEKLIEKEKDAKRRNKVTRARPSLAMSICVSLHRGARSRLLRDY